MTDVIAPRTEGQLLLRELEDHLPRHRLLHRSEPTRCQPALGRASTTTRSVAGTKRTCSEPTSAILSTGGALAASMPETAGPPPYATTAQVPRRSAERRRGQERVRTW